jgi:hypothetical protein
MAIPTDYIFTSGTCNKNQVYQLIIDSLVNAGWTDISSNPTTDFVVLKSTGNTEDKNLILNIRPTNAAAANSVVTTDYCVMSYRLQDTYTPGTSGAAGTFGRPSLAWTALYLVPVTAITVALGGDTQIKYKVYADASKLILVLEYPNSTGYQPVVIYLGQPDSIYVPESGSRGTLVAISTTSVAASSLQICNTSDGVASVTTPYSLTTYALLPPGDPNNANKRMISPIYYGNASEGFRGQLDGVKCIYYSNILTGDTITDDDGNVYYVVVAAAQGSTSFPSRALLVRIS